MNCRNFEQCLAASSGLTPEMAKHLGECAGCRSLLASLNAPEVELPAGVLVKVQTTLTHDLSPVTALPSDKAMTAAVACAFVAFCLLIASLVNFAGFHVLTVPERLIYYGIEGILGTLFSFLAVASVIPGRKVILPAPMVEFGSAIAIALVVCALFPTFNADHFVLRGIPCLRLGCLCAVLFGIIAALLLRKGWVTDIKATALLIGCFGGFSGIAVLSLHCPLLTASHILVWHGGAMAVSAIGGLLLGSLIHRWRRN